MKYNKPMSQILKEMYSEDVEKAQDKLDKAKKIDALKQQIQKIKDEPTEALDDKDKETIKPIIKQLKKSVTAHDKQAKQLTKDIEDETSQVAVDRLKRDKKAAQLKKDIKGIGEEAVDPQDTGGAEEIDMIMNQVQGMRHFLDGIERMAKDDGDIEEWVQNKITKAHDYLKTAYAYKTGEEQKESIDLEEFKTMTVTLNDPKKMKDLIQAIRIFGPKLGLKTDVMNPKKLKVYGNNTDLNKYAKDIKNFYGGQIKAESYEPLEEFTDKQIERLRKEYEDLRGKETGINPEKFKKLRGMMKRFPKANLLKLVKADIPILTTGAKAALVMYHGMKWKQLPEDFLPYIDLFADDNQEISEAKKGKFKEVDPKVVDRIEKMMNGTRQEKDSIANMLNYLMPPEVVDMVRYKLKIVPKRGKIKFR